MRRPRHRNLLVIPFLALLGLTACSSGTDDTELTVAAAASLTEPFQLLEAAFEEQNEGVNVRFSFGSSTTLAEQATQGAPGDVLATADEESMQVAETGKALAADPVRFATNRLVLVVPADNPAGITGIDDLAGSDWVRCDDKIPCGRLAVTLLADNQTAASPSSKEIDVKAVLAKVASGEADAGFVYATDAIVARDEVEVIEIPGSETELNPYFIARLEQDDSVGLADKWVAFVSSPAGQQILADAGFGRP
ncbi:molybdate transport system substrate-binding protein [Nocardioides daedukensis]|uniref:Molybdate transport system substrate-binding protein n=1 Tax=Nocardioides daedukensis TaxID=634462 RepID=A0A7Y9S5J8_9ACTN|nr:molybdate transport system substrate-binding protein [Nocardioides daedukensis]